MSSQRLPAPAQRLTLESYYSPSATSANNGSAAYVSRTVTYTNGTLHTYLVPPPPPPAASPLLQVKKTLHRLQAP